MDESKVIGNAIRTLRKEKELSQFCVAQRSGVNLSYYCKLERGEANPSIRKLYAILKALGVSPVQFTELVVLQSEYLLFSAENRAAS
ncbi:MAG: helix-turn-helix transcriptional regulator [Clostridiales bacterium]|nr:helix-turn-helix transcriptional regulator [Clostridiales bacterium]MBR4009508.1 helix-turn-helix transcriptional regulator [Clostridiales bacterium]MCR5057181.1 helix-turn-helix domain-containing protein [Clostridiales bacterium]